MVSHRAAGACGGGARGTSGHPGAFASLSCNGFLGVLTMSYSQGSQGTLGWDLLWTSPTSAVGKAIGQAAEMSMGTVP